MGTRSLTARLTFVAIIVFALSATCKPAYGATDMRLVSVTTSRISARQAAQQAATATVEVGKPKPNKPSMRQMSKKKRWSRKDVSRMVHIAAKECKIPEKRHDMLVRWAHDIIWIGAHESSGNTRSGIKSGSYAGMYQFAKNSWKLNAREKRLAKRERHVHPKGNWRYCGVCSTRRWVRSMRDYHYCVSKIRVQWPTLKR